MRRVLFAVVMLMALPVFADVSDDQIVAALRAHGTRIEESRAVLWYCDAEVPPATARDFAARLSSAVDEIEMVLGAKYDERHYGQTRIECFVSPDAGASHAYMGRKPYFFVTPQRVNAHEVPYRHELTHIIAWWSCGKALWLQEGFADWVSTEAKKRYPHRPEYDMNVFNPDNEDIRIVAREALDDRPAAKMLPLIGADAMPVSGWHRRAFNAIFKDRDITAPVFYNLSHSFVQYLIEREGLANVEAACRAWRPSRAIARRAGVGMGVLREEWVRSLK